MSSVVPPDLTGLLVSAVLGTVVVTPAISGLVLAWYRRAVGLSMRVARDRPPVLVPPHATAPDPGRPVRSRPVVLVDAAAVRGSGAGSTARRRMRSLAVVYAVSAAVFGSAAATAWLWAFGLEPEPQRFVTVAVLLAWPIVPTVLYVVAAGRRVQVLMCLGYLASVPLLTLGTQASIGDSLVVMAVVIVPPAVMLIALSGRNLRAVGPFLAAPVLVVAAGLLLWPWTAYVLLVAGASGTVARVASVVVAVVVGLVGFGYLAWSARNYAHKRASDQALLITQWWFLATVWESMVLIPSGVGAAASLWLAYLGFRVVLAIGLRLRPRPEGAPLRLLLLRTFGARRRSELLLRRVGAHWRHLGTVQMIAGTDLATATLEPHEFLDRLRGRLDRQFIGDAEQLRRRLGELDDLPDPDGRYRVNDLFCHDNTWRAALSGLLHRSDCILVDLRGFTPARRGVAYEITQLVHLADLDRVLLLTDDTTDRGFLMYVVAEASRRRDPHSPDRTGGDLRVVHLDGAHGPDPAVLLGLLAAPAPHPVVHSAAGSEHGPTRWPVRSCRPGRPPAAGDPRPAWPSSPGSRPR